MASNYKEPTSIRAMTKVTDDSAFRILSKSIRKGKSVKVYSSDPKSLAPATVSSISELKDALSERRAKPARFKTFSISKKIKSVNGKR